MSHTIHKCSNPNCHPCNHELSGCEVCKTWEGEMPTTCPGVALTQEQKVDVLFKKLDYKDGKWIWL